MPAHRHGNQFDFDKKLSGSDFEALRNASDYPCAVKGELAQVNTAIDSIDRRR
jgi:hypothetical protein